MNTRTMKKDFIFLKKGIDRHFNKDLIFDKQLTIQIGFSSVDLIFDLEHQDEPILRKVGLYK